MTLKNYNIYFFFVLLTGVTVLTFFIFKPFLIACLLGAVLARLFYPLYKKMIGSKNKRKGLCAALVILAIILIIVIPFYSIISLVGSEFQTVFNYLNNEENGASGLVEKGMKNLSKISLGNFGNFSDLVNQEEIVSLIKSFSKNTLGILQGAYQGVASLVVNSFVMFFALFYFLIDGERLVGKIMELSPLKDKYEKILIARFNSIIQAVLKETFFIAFLQGILSGVLFWLTGVASPIILGVVATLASFLPSVGAGLVWLPVGITMIILGYPIKGFVILAVGALVISTIDNVLRPKLMGKSSQVHPLLILLSTFGGLLIFGISGFIVGPIVMALFLVLWEIYALEFKNQLQEFNK